MVPAEFRLVAQARTEFFETGSISAGLQKAVRPEIIASWRRSKAFGARSDGETLLAFRPDVECEGRLAVAAQPVLKALAEDLSGLNAGVLERWVSDASILPQLDRVRSQVGFGAPEDRVGTNGVGSVAETGRAQLVVGPEHYAEGLLPFACVGAPIRNPLSRRLEGIVTMSLRADAANALLTPLMISIAADIENRLLESASLDERTLLDAYLTATRGRCRSVAVVGRHVFIGGTQSTAALEAVSPEALWAARGVRRPYAVSAMLACRSGRRAHRRSRRVRSGDG
jgi:transcriptional regulator of acetoin/glycerol metabolism